MDNHPNPYSVAPSKTSPTIKWGSEDTLQLRQTKQLGTWKAPFDITTHSTIPGRCFLSLQAQSRMPRLHNNAFWRAWRPQHFWALTLTPMPSLICRHLSLKCLGQI